MRFVIGEHDGADEPLDRRTFCAYCYWLEGGVERKQSFSIDELEKHINECRAKGMPTEQLERALAHLRRMNS